MRRTVLLFTIFFAATQYMYTQQPANSPATPAEEAAAAQKQLVAAGAKFDAAVADFNTAMANRNAAFYKLLAESGIKASECAGIGPDGKPAPFMCMKVDPVTGAVSAEKPKAKTTK